MKVPNLLRFYCLPNCVGFTALLYRTYRYEGTKAIRCRCQNTQTSVTWSLCGATFGLFSSVDKDLKFFFSRSIRCNPITTFWPSPFFLPENKSSRWRLEMRYATLSLQPYGAPVGTFGLTHTHSRRMSQPWEGKKEAAAAEAKATATVGSFTHDGAAPTEEREGILKRWLLRSLGSWQYRGPSRFGMEWTRGYTWLS